MGDKFHRFRLRIAALRSCLFEDGFVFSQMPLIRRRFRRRFCSKTNVAGVKADWLFLIHFNN
jgi:hypothetical protein